MSNDIDIQELLAGKALGDLSVDEQRILEAQMTSEYQEEFVSLERTAAAIHLAAQALDESESDELNVPMPTELSRRIASSAVRHFASSGRTELASTAEAPRQPEPVTPAQSSGTPFHGREGLAWTLLAASLLLALGLWSPSENSRSPLTAFQVRENVLASSDAIQVAWSEGPTALPEDVSGDVVWSNSSQQGVMRFVGLPINDPMLSQYQLWIIDPNRDDEPIDGGVFDVTSTGEILVPIDAKLRVVSPAAFAITIEKPGGVVVSTQEKLPLLAMVE